MTTALTAALFFRGKHESARTILKQYSYVPSNGEQKSLYSQITSSERFLCNTVQSFRTNMKNCQHRSELYH